MGEGVKFGTIDLLHRHAHPGRRIEDIANFLLVRPVRHQYHLKPTLPSLQCGENGLFAFEMGHAGRLGRQSREMQPQRRPDAEEDAEKKWNRRFRR